MKNGKISSNPVTESEYRRHIDRQSNAGNYFLFFRNYLDILPLTLTVFLQHLINIGQVKTKENGWFVCTTKELEKSMKYSDFNQVKMLRKLIDMGYVKTKRSKSIPPKRMVKVNFLTIQRDLDKAEDRSGDTPASAVVY